MGKATKKLIKSSSSREELRQVAALPMRTENGSIQVCLVTTRETRRWTIPKGWPMRDIKDCRAAAIEAGCREAGLLVRLRAGAGG